MKTKLHLIIMSLVLLFVAGGQSVCLAAESWSYPTTKPETPFGGGDGSWYDPYRIETAQHLANLAYMVTDKNTTYKNKYFILTNDITLNDDVLNDKGTGLKNDESSYKLWTPIGEYGRLYDDYFMGIFDGKGHTIRGMVCINPDGERRYNGFFGTTDDATIMNLNLEDCYLASNDVDGIEQNYGSLVGVTRNTTFKDCHVSKTLVKVNYNYNGFTDDTFCCVGGMIGQLDLPRWNVASSYKTHLTNCSFKGNIDVTVHKFLSVRVGGLFAYQYKDPAFAAQYLYLANCNTEGNINIYSTYSSNKIYVGGVTSAPGRGGNEIKNCVNRMNITVDGEMDFCRITGFGDFWEAKDRYKVSQCVCSGTIKVGSESNKAKISGLEIYGFICNDRSFLRNCAFYGKYDIHSQGSYVYITPLCDDLYVEDSEVPGVVCSVGNVFDLDYKNSPNLDQVSNKTITLDKDNKEQPAKHKVYYHFEYTGGVTFPCNGTADASKYNKSLDEMKTDDFIKTLNTDAGSNVWGKMTGMNDESLNGLPMPVACGGMVTEYSGTGTLSDPYIINTESDLDRLKQSVSNGSSFEGIYFKLGSDIYITGTLDESIGNVSEKPFKGHFDGNGHAIIGLRKSLFGYMYGKVKNLALVDCNIWDGNYATALARQVGDESNKAAVSNCYISGTISFNTPWDQLGYASTFAFQLANGSSIHDCYFKGRFVVKQQTFSTYNVAGIAFYNSNRTVNTSAESPKGIFNCYASFDVKVEASVMETRYTYGISNDLKNESNGNYFVCSDYRVSENSNGGTKLDSESELNGKFNGKTGWLQGVYRPVLASAKKYAATTPEKNPETVYFDAIPEANHKKNYFYNISIDDPYSDVSLWNLPNMAVYVPSEQVDYITNGYLDQSSEFRYKRSEGATATLGQLHFALIQNDKGTHFVCLPGEVLKSDLPEGSDAMIGGKVNIVNDEEQVNVVHVDTIPAGVPCLLYVPVSSVQSGEEIDILMRSGIVSEPVLNADYSSFKGTFTPQAVSKDACMDVAKGTATRAATRSAAQDDTYYFILGNENTQVKPFSSWLEGSLGNVRIVDYMLLDEYNNTNVELIESSTDDVNIKLRLTMDADKWTTICLPFDMSTEEIVEKFGEDTKLEEVESISYEGSTLNIKLKEVTDGIVSGSPYFIKPSVSNSIFELGPRILSNELTDVGNLAYSPDANQEIYLKMSGWVDVSMLRSAEEYNAYYFNDGTLCQLPREYPLILGGFRCWFKASDSTASAPAELSSVIITHSDGTTTDISVVTTDSQSTKQNIYDLNGIEMKSEKGIYIKGGKVRIKN